MCTKVLLCSAFSSLLGHDYFSLKQRDINLTTKQLKYLKQEKVMIVVLVNC